MRRLNKNNKRLCCVGQILFDDFKISRLNVVIEEIKCEQVTAAVTTAVDFTQSGGSIWASQSFL